MPCKHAKLALIYAQQMAEMDEPWKLWEYRNYKEWQQCLGHPSWYDETEYRQIPRTIRIGNFDVPEPMREKPEIDTGYWFVDPGGDEKVLEYVWINDQVDNRLLNRGLMHTTKDAAIIHAKALFSFSEVG